ncbi:CPBP family intramembrane metalloprotease [Flavobacterium azooxidireducens]|uniref:CPBP family intramembrane metalloprotease n=1 Tax=Flavobacterium azooxidireducens TaxID=1871076 RepID=A0ABY4KMK8_9FLAO|nr:CPBP family intramembrane glutamic endopeptidase [Flavobacterium azooxidireducens]UPQ80467.1 CPBP family intramembrane metalloprotease [Flavobacterium azooxidireducens]
MAKTLTKYKFFIYIIFYLISVSFSVDYENKLLYPLLFLLLVFFIEFKKDIFNEEKINLDKQFLLDFFLSIFFSLSVYIFLYSIGVFFNYESYERVALDFSILNIITVVILYPVFEELFFRKLYFSTYKSTKFIGLILLNGFVFSISHIFSDTPLLNAFIFGCCFFLIYLKNKKIIFSVFSHILINSLLFITYQNQENITAFVKNNNLFIFIISFITTIYFFYSYFRKVYKKS